MNYKVVRLASPGEVSVCACGGSCDGRDSICGKYVKEIIANGMAYDSGKACNAIKHILDKAQSGFEEGCYYTILNGKTNSMAFGTVYHLNEGFLKLLSRETYLSKMSAVKPIGRK